ncbi:VOC family protein [Candidimonas nitroreducens]|nr:VOC family protein [Candidimonas nitroreducens]
MSMLIKHISVNVTDLEQARAFYEEVCGYRHVRTAHTTGFDGDHISCHLTDGNLDLTLLYYGEGGGSEKSPNAQPHIHHFGMEVENPDEFIQKVESWGGKVISPPGDVRVKFRIPNLPMLEIVPAGRWTKPIRKLMEKDT